MNSSSDRPCYASTARVVWQHPEEDLGELHDHLDAEDDGLALGLDALDRRVPAAGFLLLVHTVECCAARRRLTCHSNCEVSILQ